MVKHKEDIARSLVLASQRTSIKHPLCEARKEWTLRVLSQTRRHRLKNGHCGSSRSYTDVDTCPFTPLSLRYQNSRV